MPILWFPCAFRSLLIHSRVDADDSESIRLLRTLTSPSVLITGKTRDVMDETSATVKCSRCGFMNSKYSTVCKDCNALLHEEGFFKDAKETAYFCSLCSTHELCGFGVGGSQM